MTLTSYWGTFSSWSFSSEFVMYGVTFQMILYSLAGTWSVLIMCYL